MHPWLSRSRPSQAPSEPEDRPPAAGAARSPATGLVHPAIFVGIYALLAAAAWWLSAPVWNLVFAGFVLLVLRELYVLVALGSRLLRAVGLLASALLLLQPLVAPSLPGTLILSITWLCCFALLSLSTDRPHRRELNGLLMMACGVLSVTLTLGQLVAIRHLPAGREWATLVVLTVAARESSAALGGFLVPGAPTINRSVSPRKTYAGWLAGATASLVTAVIFTRAFGLAMTLWQAAIFGLCLGVACQLGDLSESYLKRMRHRRHSSNVLGPQGGLLDTTDALAFAAVVAHGLLLVWGSGP